MNGNYAINYRLMEEDGWVYVFIEIIIFPITITMLKFKPARALEKSVTYLQKIIKLKIFVT